LSQEELAYRAGLHRTYISSIERGQRNVSLENIFAIARALKVTPADLVKLISPKESD
jgi:transcriptional regulator with XRE-family HTH domain